MKRSLSILFLVILTAVGLVSACGKKIMPNVGVNLVDDIPPRWDGLHQHAAQTLNTLKVMKAEGKGQPEIQAFLEKEWPTLRNDVVARLRMSNRLPGNDAEKVVFNFGSAQNIKADDANGIEHAGYFSNELVASVFPRGGGKSVDVLVRCLNGYFIVDGGEITLDRGWTETPIMQFKVEHPWGLTHYVDFPTAVELAERFDLKMFRGKGKREVEITPAQARLLRDKTDQVFVKVLVYHGDEFNLVDMVYKPVRGAVRTSH